MCRPTKGGVLGPRRSTGMVQVFTHLHTCGPVGGAHSTSPGLALLAVPALDLHLVWKQQSTWRSYTLKCPVQVYRRVWGGMLCTVWNIEPWTSPAMLQEVRSEIHQTCSWLPFPVCGVEPLRLQVLIIASRYHQGDIWPWPLWHGYFLEPTLLISTTACGWNLNMSELS